MRFPGFIGPTYKHQSLNVDAQRCINLYPELHELGTGKEQEVACLIGTPGLRDLLDLEKDPIRGMHVDTKNRELFVVASNKLYRVSSSWQKEDLGTLSSSTGLVGMSDNGIDLVIVDGPNGYRFNLENEVFAPISDPDFSGATHVDYMDGYLIFNDPNSGRFYHTDLDAVTFDALDDAQAEGHPDDIRALVVHNRQLWLFGYDTTEVFFNSGGEQVFVRFEGAFIEKGIAAPRSIAKTRYGIFFLARDKDGQGTIELTQGYQSVKVSTTPIDHAIQKYSNMEDAVAWTYQQDGHFFYVLNFTEDNATWVYDVSTKLWHERAYLSNGKLYRHRGNFHALAYGKHVVGDFENGKLYELDPDYYKDGDDLILRRRVAPHLTRDLSLVRYKAFQLDLETGVGLDGEGFGTDPQAVLRFSDDGGHTWSNERWAGIGKIGQKLKRSIWRKLGRTRSRTFEITITAPVKVVILGADLEVGA